MMQLSEAELADIAEMMAAKRAMFPEITEWVDFSKAEIVEENA